MPSPLGCGCLPGHSGSIFVTQQAVLDSDKPNNIVPYQADSKPNFSLYYTRQHNRERPYLIRILSG